MKKVCLRMAVFILAVSVFGAAYAADPFMVKDIRTGTPGSNPSNMTNVNGTLFFQTNDGTNGCELWKSDGTAANTVMVKDICSGAEGSYPGSLSEMNGTLFFQANDGTTGWELWKSDGAAANTIMVKDTQARCQNIASCPKT